MQPMDHRVEVPRGREPRPKPFLGEQGEEVLFRLKEALDHMRGPQFVWFEIEVRRLGEPVDVHAPRGGDREPGQTRCAKIDRCVVEEAPSVVLARHGRVDDLWQESRPRLITAVQDCGVRAEVGRVRR